MEGYIVIIVMLGCGKGSTRQKELLNCFIKFALMKLKLDRRRKFAERL